MTTTEAQALEASRAPGSAVRALFVLVALTAALWLVNVFGRTLPSAALVLAWAAATAGIGVALFRRARVRRAAFLKAYVRGGSPLERRLRGGWLMAAGSTLVAALLALFLLAAVLRLEDRGAWLVLIASAPLLVLTQAVLERALAPHSSGVYLPELAWRATAAVVGTAMVAALVLLAYHRPYPELAGASLEQAVWHMVDQERARSAPAEGLLQAAAAADALRLWLAQQLMPSPGTSLAQAAGWLVLLAEEALFVWSYLSLCSAALLGSRSR